MTLRAGRSCVPSGWGFHGWPTDGERPLGMHGGLGLSQTLCSLAFWGRLSVPRGHSRGPMALTSCAQDAYRCPTLLVSCPRGSPGPPRHPFPCTQPGNASGGRPSLGTCPPEQCPPCRGQERLLERLSHQRCLEEPPAARTHLLLLAICVEQVSNLSVFGLSASQSRAAWASGEDPSPALSHKEKWQSPSPPVFHSLNRTVSARLRSR